MQEGTTWASCVIQRNANLAYHAMQGGKNRVSHTIVFTNTASRVIQGHPNWASLSIQSGYGMQCKGAQTCSFHTARGKNRALCGVQSQN